jgi:hypothetical protein
MTTQPSTATATPVMGRHERALRVAFRKFNLNCGLWALICQLIDEWGPNMCAWSPFCGLWKAQKR